MTLTQLLKKLEYFQIEDYQDLLGELIKNYPEVKSALEIKFGFATDDKIIGVAQTKIKKELAKKYLQDEYYYAYKPSKAKEYMKSFGKICQDKKKLIELMFFYFFEYSATITKKENEDYHVLQTVHHGLDQVFVDICKEIKKQNSAELWHAELKRCLELTRRWGYDILNKKDIYFYPLEKELTEILDLGRENLE